MEKMLVKQWMTPDPITVDVNSSLSVAYHLMRLNNVRRLPVLDEREYLIGILTWSDIRNASPRSRATPSESSWEAHFLAGTRAVGDYMTLAPLTVTPDTSMRRVVEFMMEHKIDGFPVVVDRRVVGIITEVDVFRFILDMLSEQNPIPAAVSQSG